MERGRDPLIPLDRDSAILARAPTREDTKEFVARIWNIEAQVAERLAKAADYDALTMDEKSRITKDVRVGARVWLSAHGITMPVKNFHNVGTRMEQICDVLG